MKSSVENLEPTKVKVTIEVPFEEFKPAIDTAAKEISKQVNIPGFRRGHVPARVLEARFGRGVIVEEAVNKSLDGYYGQAVASNDLHPMSRPQVDVTQAPVEKGDTSDLVFEVTVDVRPEIIIPDPSGVTITVDPVEVTEEDVDARLDSLRERFGSLKDVDRAAAQDDYVSIDMVATIGDEEVDSVTGVSYRIGSGTMVEGLDEALTGLKAGDTATFTTKLAGGEHEGEEADVTVTVQNVKESELPEADDDFAQLASEFDTVAELREDLREQVAKDKATNQVYAARDKVVSQLRESVEFDLPTNAVEEEVARHLEQEGKEPDDPHAVEAREETQRLMRDQLLLDVLAEGFDVQVEQNELFNFMVEQAQAYGMDPNQFIQAAAQSNQLGAFASELARGKAVLSYLRLATVVDTEGQSVDVVSVIGEAPEGEKVPQFGVAQSAARAGGEAAEAEAAKVSGEDGAFDPASAKVDEVIAYVANVDDEEKARVIEAEKAGKNRKTLLEKLER
ncbi:MAG: trigger factor [Actinomycetaceae bacterium]|nr:trigger factor [Actinomycetaceae bacterium]